MKKIFLLLFSSILLVAAPKFLMPDEAFIPDAQIDNEMTIEVNIELAKDMYLYEDRVSFEINDKSGISVKEVQKPKSFDHGGDMVYTTSPKFIITLQKDAGVSGTKNIAFEVLYQGCSEQGLCYEPLDKTYKFEVDSSNLSLSGKNVTIEVDVATDTKELSETDSIAQAIGSGSFILVVLTFLGFGLLLALTPCTFPMIPIISGLIISHGEGITTKKAFLLSVVYVLAMSVAYTIAGVLAGLFGANLQAALQTPWVIYSFAGIFVALAMSMFGFYQLKLPDSIVAKMSKSRDGTGYAGVAIMGFLSALIVGPCVAAPLAGALVYIGQTGDAVLGGMALFAMSIGMGLPLIAVGVSAGKFMPKPGGWMNLVTAIFGVMMLGVAIWMLERVVDVYITMILWSMLGISFAIYLGALEKDMHIFKKSVAVITLIYSLALFIGALGGSTSMLKPLEFLKPQVISASVSIAEKSHAEFKRVTSLSELDAILAESKGKKIMLDFYADWCTSCKELEEVTFADASVKAKMSELVLIQADVTDNTQAQKDLSKKYGVFGPPAMIFFDTDGKVMGSKTIVGFVGPQEFLKHLNKI